MTKRLFDISVSLVVLLVLALPLAGVALAITFFDGRPVLYRQRRAGRGGQPFWLYKFRTMKVSNGGSLITTKGDPRITLLGRFLRRWKLDELPQFWNVVRGEMSLVGPRPEVERFVCHYTPEQRLLLHQTPGIASLSQLVYPHESNMLRGYPEPEVIYLQQLMPKKIAVDLEYERRRTFWSDLRLLAEVVLLILGKSYRIDHNFHLTPTENPLKTSTPKHGISQI
jgi:lipopolysaccharide/colanic/teichoic acid biosynthesis glycosyltransferase